MPSLWPGDKQMSHDQNDDIIDGSLGFCPHANRLVSLEDTKKTKCSNWEITEASRPALLKLIEEMYAIMFENNGIGLAAPQIGVYKNVFVVGLKDRGSVKRYAVVNPVIDILTTRYTMETEGCLTIPGKLFIVPRFSSIRLKGFDAEGNALDWFCKGRLSQVVQHEVAHLRGVCIGDGPGGRLEP